VRATLAGGIAVLAIAVVAITVLEPFGSSESRGSVATGAPPATATVDRGPLSSQVYQRHARLRGPRRRHAVLGC
jgi:hypothetical protein